MDKRSRPVSIWTEKELLNGGIVDALVVILRTKGCSWHKKEGCLMCGYHIDSDPSIKDEEVLDQVHSAFERDQGMDIVKLYTSGSFFDEDEISGELRRGILEVIGKKAKQLVVESRPEYITGAMVKEALGFVNNLEVAIGLESANELVLKKCVNKGITFEDYKRGANHAKEAGATVRTYLLVKPPFLTEKEAVEDSISSASIAANYSDVISFNPLNVQRGTRVERLWRRAEYRPPWLWSVLNVIERSKNLEPRIICSPSGGGTKRGAHNCGSCDKAILDALNQFSMGARESFDDLDCRCKQRWLDLLELEGFIRTSGDVEKTYL